MTTQPTGAAELPEALFYASALENCADVDFDHIFVPAGAVIRRLHALLNEQQRTIEALNACINGEGSTTTENLRLVDRLHAENEALRAQPAGAATPAAPAPVVPSDAQILAVAANSGLGEFVSRTSRYELGNQLLAFGRNLLAAAPQPPAAAQEPVGVITGKLGDICQFRSTTMRKGDAVYAAPQPAVTAGAVDARITAIEQAIRDYHYALDTRQHGGVAQDRAFNAISNVMGMHWTQGAESSRRALSAQPGGTS